MKIEQDINQILVNFNSGSINKSAMDPFDLSLEVTELRLYGNDRPTSMYFCSQGIACTTVCSRVCTVTCATQQCDK
jgi:hypothetical protein